MIIGAICILLLLVGIAAHAFRRGHLRVASPVSLMIIWCAVLFVGRPLFVELSNHWWLIHFYALGHPDERLLFEVFASVAVGILAYYVGYWLPNMSAVRRVRLPSIPVSTKQVVAVATVFLLWGLYAFARYRPLPIDTGLYDEGFRIEEGKFVETTSYVASAWTCITAVIYLLSASLRRRLPSLALLVFFGIAVFYGGWSRSVALVATLGVAMIEELRNQRRLVAASVLIVFPLLVPVFNQLSVDREYIQKEWKGESAPVGDVEEFLPNEFSDFDGYVGIVSQVPEKLNYSYGMDMVNRFFVIAIPRVLWTEKRELFMPEDRYSVRARVQQGGHVNTIWGPLYMEGGLIAIVLVLGLSGFVARWAYELVLSNRDHPYYVPLYVLFHLHFLSSWRDLFMPQYFFLIGQPVFAGLLLALATRRGHDSSVDLASAGVRT